MSSFIAGKIASKKNRCVDDQRHFYLRTYEEIFVFDIFKIIRSLPVFYIKTITAYEKNINIITVLLFYI